MSANQQPASGGKKITLIIGALLLVAIVFVVVMCTAGQPKFLEAPADFQAPNN